MYVSDTEGPETSPIGAAALLLGCRRDMKGGGGKTEALPCKEVGGRCAGPLLGKPSPPLWPAMGSPQISVVHIYSSVHDHGGNQRHLLPSGSILPHPPPLYKLTGTMTSSGSQQSYMGEPGLAPRT